MNERAPLFSIQPSTQSIIHVENSYQTEIEKPKQLIKMEMINELGKGKFFFYILCAFFHQARVREWVVSSKI